jgi:rhodanese-related sulfurtransferase
VKSVKIVVLEALLVVLAGLALGLIANAVSPLGLRLSRNYFPTASDVPGNSHSSAGPVTIAATNPLAATIQRLRERGLQTVSSNEVAELFRDNRYQQGLIVFVDARDDDHYHSGHIPGAWQFNHYRAEQFLPTVLPLCLTAQKVVVYCTGGACEDSEFAAIMLRDGGVAKENVYVYAGGITEWMANGSPVETGARGGGQITNAKP